MDLLHNQSLAIDVCLGTATTPRLVSLRLPIGSTLKQAVLASQLIEEKAIDEYRFGIYGELKPLDTLLSNHDRVEIYTPLQIDPKTARALRVKKTRLTNPTEGRKWRTNK